MRKKVSTYCFKKNGPHGFSDKIKTSQAISFKYAESVTDTWDKVCCES